MRLVALSSEESATKAYYEISQSTDTQELSSIHPSETLSSDRVASRGKNNHIHPSLPRSPSAHMTVNQIDKKLSKVEELTLQLTRSLRRPSSRTLRLIDKALSYLLPFESPRASVTSVAEKQELLTLLNTHRLSLSPYLDLDRIESNLRCL
ncbi:MAG: hypothetical protein K2K25_04830 [Muribaculaceae bacterium]|nr:hypothetical protein [Muribaculaceae bacterium]